MFRGVHGALVALILALAWGSARAGDEALTVFVAKKVITMDPTRPTATAVAVRGRRVVSVGSLEDLRPWLDAHPHTVDERFADKVLMPGLIDPHLHPLLGALQLGATWITPEAWQLHDGSIPATRTPEQYQQRLREALAAADDEAPLFVTWGWSEPVHGPMTRGMLDELNAERPIMVWQRSVHEAIFNTAALEWMGLTEEDGAEVADAIDWPNGHFFEAGLFDVAMTRLAPYLMSPEFLDSGFARNTEYFISGGITTSGDMSTGKPNWELELGARKRNLIDKGVPYRTVLIPAAYSMSLQKGGLEASFEFLDDFLTAESPAPQIVHGKRIKLFADGAMFSQLMQLGPPGYIDGHEGEWVTPLADFEAQARKYWLAGYRIHVHANGDRGVARTLDVFEKLQLEHPRLPHSLVLEHYGYADDVVNRRVAVFGAAVSANPYYLTALADTYARVGLGTDRANRITPLAGLVERGVPVALHSDFAMAPARPLYLAWCAATRRSAEGKDMTPPRGLTLDEALRAITVDAAYVLGLEGEIGSIQSGKLADFAVLEADPYEVGVEGLKDIGVWGTVFEGRATQAK